LNLTALALAAAVWIVGILYNWRYKETELLGNTMVSFSVAMTFVLGGVAVERPRPTTQQRGKRREPFEIESDAAESFTPLSITGRWKRTKYPVKVSLFVDGIPRPEQRHWQWPARRSCRAQLAKD
jgi:hypothetical protein